MRIDKLFLGTIAFTICLLFMSSHTVLAEEALTVNKGTWAPLNERIQHGVEMDVVSEDYILEGLTDQYESYYEVPTEGAGENSELTLHMNYSDLLKKGSSITVSIDGVPVKSVEINTKNKNEKVKIKLSGDNLTPGFHTIGFSFYGHVTEDMCVNKENTANWLTIQSRSSVFLALDEDESYTNMLQTYPYPFIQQSRNEAIQATVVIPNDPSDEALSAALQIAHALRDEAVTDSNVPIVFEKDIDTIPTHMIAIGETDAWESDVHALIKQAKVKGVKDEVSIHTYNVDDSTSMRAFMLITGERGAPLAEYVRVLTDENLAEQLSGEKISLKHMPPVEEKTFTSTMTFETIGIGDMTLSGSERMSPIYFHHFPDRMLHEEHAVLQLNLKIAETLRSERGEQEAELVVMINDVPHSVAIDELVKEDEESFYEVHLPVDKKTYEESAFMKIQLIAHGLRKDVFCATNDDERWIYIDDSSMITLPKKVVNDAFDFSSWPSPFGQDEQLNTMLIVPNILTTDSIASLHHLTNTLSATSELHNLEIVSSEEITAEDLIERNVIFVGNLAEHELLQSSMDDLLIKQTADGALDVAAYQFINESAAFVGWIQPSVWDENYQMSVFAPVQADESAIMSPQLLNYVQSTPLHAHIVVEAKNGEIFSQVKTKEEHPELVNEKENETEEMMNGWYIAGFIAIIVFSILAIVYLSVRRKKEGR